MGCKFISQLQLLVFILVLMSCNNSEKNVSKDFAQFVDSFSVQSAKLDPLLATDFGNNSYNNLFPDYLSEDYKKQYKGFYTNSISSLENFSKYIVNQQDRLTFDCVLWECRMKLQELDFKKDFLPIDHVWTKQLQMGRMASTNSTQPFNTLKDYLNWIERLEGYVVWLKSVEEKMRNGLNRGYTLPKIIAEKTCAPLEQFATKTLEDHLFYAPCKNWPESFTQTEKRDIENKISKLIEDELKPTYQSLYSFMKEEYIPNCRETVAYSDLSDGKEYYQHQIKKYTTTDLTAKEIYDLGMKEVNRITSEMVKVKDQLKFKGSMKDFFKYMANNKALTPYTDQKDILTHFKSIHTKVIPFVNQQFNKQPKMSFEIRRTEAFRETAAGAEYVPGSVESGRAGVFYVSMPVAEEFNIAENEALFLHEAIPGHHFQIALTQENESLPEFRKSLWYDAYGEGWALYCESLGKELGLYDDPYQYFGMLNMEMHRAIRLVVDAGMHALGMTREEAIQFSLDHEMTSRAGTEAEIDRYIANPGQALSYKVGQLKIQELRKYSAEKLGDKFDVKTFHDQILETGCIPLMQLENKIKNWVETQEQ